MTSVYLAGPIQSLSYEGCTGWREHAIRWLAKYNIEGVSPMRAKEELAKEPIMADNFQGVMTNPKAIVSRDRFDCMNSDILLVNLLGAKEKSIGTMVEYGWADAFRKPIITVMEREGNVHDHPFVRELSGYRVETLNEGLLVARAILA